MFIGYNGKKIGIMSCSFVWWIFFGFFMCICCWRSIIIGVVFKESNGLIKDMFDYLLSFFEFEYIK